ncbi:MAG TPA: hypothetical protein VFH67_05600 [bacterium]|nr:hypothetical protein [bacterium]
MPGNEARIAVEIVHLELYIVPRKHRAAFRKSLQEPIRIAQKITHAGGGSGPYFYRVEPQRARRGTPQIGTILRVKPNEDLWVEIAFYRDWRRRRSILRKIWGNPKFVASVGVSEGLVSRRPNAWGVANAALQEL